MCFLRRKPRLDLPARLEKVERHQDEIDRRVNMVEAQVQVAMRTDRGGA